MPKGPRVTPEIEQLIARVYIEHNGWTAKQVRNEVHERLKRENPALIQAHAKFPSVSIVEKKLASLKTKGIAPQTEDRYWTRVTLAQYPMPPDALPAVLKVWAEALRKDKPLTIRQAKWAAQLCRVFKDADRLWSAAVECSYWERALIAIPPADKLQAMAWFWVGDGYLYRMVAGEEWAGDITNKVQDMLQERKL